MATGITHVPLARTGLTVPTVIFGSGGLTNTDNGEADRERARETVRAIFRSPVNALDTSRIYGRGRSEDRIGEVIAERGGLPEGFVLATKLDRDPETGRFDADAARRSLEESLRALHLDRVHILHLHDPEFVSDLSQVTGRGGAIAELFKMKEEGFADAVGLAAGAVDVMMPMLRDWDFDAMLTHNRFTLVNRNAEAMIDLAVSRGMAVLNAAPYGGGVFAKGTGTTTKYAYREASERTLQPVRQIEAICARHKVPPGAAALQFSMRDPRITATVCGVSRPERVQQTVEWANWQIPEAVWEELKAVPYSTKNPQAADG
jgi:D-threo-aldose 1-dehydrogenase